MLFLLNAFHVSHKHTLLILLIYLQCCLYILCVCDGHEYPTVIFMCLMTFGLFQFMLLPIVPRSAAGSTFPPLSPGTPRLYSMRFCPFAQRARLVLAHKRVQ